MPFNQGTNLIKDTYEQEKKRKNNARINIPAWIWARWSCADHKVRWCSIGCYAPLWHLRALWITNCIYFIFERKKADKPVPKHRRQWTTWQIFCQVERRFHSHESNRQPLPWDLGISPPSSGSSGSSRTMNRTMYSHEKFDMLVQSPR